MNSQIFCPDRNDHLSKIENDRGAEFHKSIFQSS